MAYYRCIELCSKKIQTVTLNCEIRHVSWGESLTNFKEFLSKYKRYPSFCKTNKYEKKIAQWVHDQRKQKNNLTKEKQEKLQKINFLWEAEDLWENKFEELKQWLCINNYIYILLLKVIILLKKK